jgi:uncharacterized protein YjiK
MRKIGLIISLFSTVSVFSQNIFPYNLNCPNNKYVLPEILNEISGLTDIDSAHIACVQDELGIVFIYNFLIDSIIARHSFDSLGDFEGLTYTGNSLFILRSDGLLTEWKNFNPIVVSGEIVQHKLSLLTADNEGLCFDSKENRLLIAAKSKPLDYENKSERYIYAFDKKTQNLVEEPVYSINVEELAKTAVKFKANQTEKNKKGEFKPFNFRPSSLAVHPQTNEIYIISASDFLLIVMDINSQIVYMQKLNKDIFTKAEGITFIPDGTMIITNEAAGKTPSLLIFNKAK